MLHRDGAIWRTHGSTARRAGIAVIVAIAVAAATVTVLLVERRPSPSLAALLPPHATSPDAPAPSGRSGLQSLACTSSTACVGAGFRSAPAHPDFPQPLVERWDGAAWSPAPAPLPGGGGQVASIVCASARSCVAVGYTSATGAPDDEHPLVATWDGAAWSVAAVAGVGARGTLQSVACAAASSCVAVGTTYTGTAGHRSTLAVAGSGRTWSVVPSPGQGTDSWLNAVSCVGPASCVAVGMWSDVDPTDEEPGSSTLVETWNGSAWSIVPSPDPGTGGEGALLSVSCASPTSCVAVGSYSAVDNPYRAEYATLAETWNGTAWSLAATPSPSNRAVLRSVACTSPTSCLAVGAYETGGYAGNSQPLVESWNGTAWSVEGAPPTGPGSRELDAVACMSATACVAVGQVSTTAHAVASSPLGEVWDGSSWSATR